MAILGGGASANTFNISGWTSTAAGSSIGGGGGADTIIGNFPTANNTSFTFSNTSLAIGGVATFAINGVSTLNLTGGTGAETFADNGFSGTGGTLSTGTGTGTIDVTIDANIALSNAALKAGSAAFAISGFKAANLTGGASNNTFTLTGWTGTTNTLNGGGGNDVIALTADANFTLSNTKLALSTGVTWSLSNIGNAAAILGGGASDNTFDISGWSSTSAASSIAGNGGSDTVVATLPTLANANIAFSDTSLAITGVSTFTLSGIARLDLTGGTGTETFTDNAFHGTGGTLGTGTGTGTLVVGIDANITLKNAQLIAGPATFTLAGFNVAKLSGGASDNVFDVSGWSSTAAGSSIVGGGGADTVVASGADRGQREFHVQRHVARDQRRLLVQLGQYHEAGAERGNGQRDFHRQRLPRQRHLARAGTGNGTLTVNIDANITLSDAQLVAGPATFALSGFHAANLTGGTSNNVFTLSGWSGAANTLNGGGGADTIILAADAGFTLSNTNLSLSTGVVWTLSNVAGANALLTGGNSGNTFTVSAWNGPATLKGGTGDDTFDLGAGNLDLLTGRFIVAAGVGNDQLTLDDSAIDNPYNYFITGTSIAADATTPRPWGGVTIDASLESATIDGTQGANKFFVTPSVTTSFFVNGDDPAPGGATGDYLAVQFFGTIGRHLNTTGPGAGSWTFTDAHKTIVFTGIENVNDPIAVPFAVGAEAGIDSKPLVQLVNGLSGEVLLQFYAYPITYTGGVRVAMGDMNGDGTPDIITAPGRNIAGVVKVFDGKTGALIGQFQPYPSSYVGGVEIAVGDIDGDGKPEIIVAQDRGAPKVSIYRGPSGNFQLVGSFYAYETTFIGGVSLAAADLDGDGKAEIITGSGSGRTAEVRVFNGETHALIKDIVAFDPSFRGGITVSTGDVDGDGTPDIVVGQNQTGTSLVRAFNGATFAVMSTVTAYTDPSSNATVHFVLRDAAGIGRVQLYVSQGTDGRNHDIRVFDLLSGTYLGSTPITTDDLLGGIWLG